MSDDKAPQPPKYILAYLLDNPPVGYSFVRSRDNWPYHITLLPWFKTDHLQDLQQGLRLFCARSQRFSITIGRHQLFGTEHDISVNVLRNPTRFQLLHEGILALINGMDVLDYNTRFIGDRYTPHVTRHHNGEDGCRDGQMVSVTGVHLIKLAYQDTCEVIDYYPFLADADSRQ